MCRSEDLTALWSRKIELATSSSLPLRLNDFLRDDDDSPPAVVAVELFRRLWRFFRNSVAAAWAVRT